MKHAQTLPKEECGKGKTLGKSRAITTMFYHGKSYSVEGDFDVAAEQLNKALTMFIESHAVDTAKYSGESAARGKLYDAMERLAKTLSIYGR